MHLSFQKNLGLKINEYNVLKNFLLGFYNICKILFNNLVLIKFILRHVLDFFF